MVELLSIFELKMMNWKETTTTDNHSATKIKFKSYNQRTLRNAYKEKMCVCESGKSSCFSHWDKTQESQIEAHLLQLWGESEIEATTQVLAHTCLVIRMGVISGN